MKQTREEDKDANISTPSSITAKWTPPMNLEDSNQWTSKTLNLNLTAYLRLRREMEKGRRKQR